MRILKYLFIGFFIITSLSSISFLIAREVVIHWGVSVLRASARELTQAQSQGGYEVQCRREGKSVSPNGIIFQLRFLSDSEYVLEALCNEGSTQPIAFDRNTLPPFVEKIKGSSGFITNGSPSGVELAAFVDLGNEFEKSFQLDANYVTKSKKLQFDEGVLIETKDPTVIGNGPLTSCTGYGYTCCRDESEQGIGDRISGLIDCEKSCYSQCVSRPIILSFTSNPFFELQTRTVTIPAGTTVEFIYVGDGGSSKTITGLVEFGDGGTETITEENGLIDHTYTCALSLCTYMAKIQMTDSWGVHSADLPVNKITIAVQGK